MIRVNETPWSEWITAPMSDERAVPVAVIESIQKANLTTAGVVGDISLDSPVDWIDLSQESREEAK